MSDKKLTNLTLGEFRNMTRDLPDETAMSYHGYYKGCRLSSYTADDVWFFPKGEPTKSIVLNPADDYDNRASRKII